ncbi:MAG: PAS domain S-box protein [Candidatus Promineifilaceae bacterium]
MKTNSRNAYTLTLTSITVIVVSCLVLLGWILNIPPLQYILPSLPKMTFNTAVTFVLAGLSLWFYSTSSKSTASHSRQRIAQLLAVLVTVIGLITLTEYLFGWNLGLDQLLFKDAAAVEETTIPGRPSPYTAIAFTLIGIALFLSQRKSHRLNWLAQYLTLSAAFIALLALVGYVFSISIFFRISPYTGMALHTALNFIILSIGLFFLHPNSGFTATITADNLGGVMARRLLIAAFIIPIVVGWISMLGERAGLYSNEFEQVLLAVLSTYVLSAVIWRYAQSLNQAENHRKKMGVTLRESETRIRKSEERFSKVFHSSPSPMTIARQSDGVYIEANESFLTLIDYSREEVIGHTSVELNLIDAEGRAEIRRRLSQLGIIQNIEVVARAKSGQRLNILTSIENIELAGEACTITTMLDITERKQAEELFRLVVEASPNGIILVDSAGKISLVNERVDTLFGYDREELIGQPVEILVPKQFRTNHNNYQTAYFSAPTIRPIGAGRDLFGLRKDGRQIPVEIGLNPVTTTNGKFVLASIIDITERKQGEQQFRLAVEASPNALIMVGVNGKISLVNTQAEALFGYDREELLGQTIDMLVPSSFHDHHKTYRDAFFNNPTARPMGAGRDLFGLRKDGRQVPVEIGLNPITTTEGEFVLASIIDITERKQAEAEIANLLQREQAARTETTKLNEELEQRVTERTAQLEAANKELEAFSYSVSHDLRAPLRSIDGFSQALLEDYLESLDDDAQDYLKRVRAASQRMAQLIDDMLMLSRITRSEMNRETVDLSRIAKSIAENLTQTEPERQVEFDIPPNVTVEADRHLMEVVLENLIGNAWKFTSKNATARIEFGTITQSNEHPAYFVRDNGAGFDMTYSGKLFGAFQRLHSSSDFPGTGIGLATVQRVINRHGGSVWAESKENQGATFYFTISSS